MLWEFGRGLLDVNLRKRVTGHEITVLYYNNAKKGFKFIGDDPERSYQWMRDVREESIY